MEQKNELNTESNNKLSEGNKPIYFSMSMPNWFMNKSTNEKCDIVNELAAQLKGVEPISPQESMELFSIN